MLHYLLLWFLIKLLQEIEIVLILHDLLLELPIGQGLRNIVAFEKLNKSNDDTDSYLILVSHLLVFLMNKVVP
jgi:hypothetical protein